MILTILVRYFVDYLSVIISCDFLRIRLRLWVLGRGITHREIAISITSYQRCIAPTYPVDVDLGHLAEVVLGFSIVKSLFSSLPYCAPKESQSTLQWAVVFPLMLVILKRNYYKNIFYYYLASSQQVVSIHFPFCLYHFRTLFPLSPFFSQTGVYWRNSNGDSYLLPEF